MNRTALPTIPIPVANAEPDTRLIPSPRLFPPAPGEHRRRWRIRPRKAGLIAAVVAAAIYGVWQLQPVGAWLLEVSHGGAR